MDYMDVYTPYTLLFTIVITLCIMTSALLCAYLSMRTKRAALFIAFIFVQAMLLAWLFGRLMEFVSPTAEIRLISLFVQKTGVLLLIAAQILFFPALAKRAADKKLLFLYSLPALAVLLCALSFFTASGLVYDLSSVCAFISWNLFIFIHRADIFPELSALSIDAFMERLEDAVVIFDRDGLLADCNQTAKDLFPLAGSNQTIEDFFGLLNDRSVSGNAFSSPGYDLFEPAEIMLEGPCGIRHYLCGVTVSENKRHVRTATIFTFHDVTEKAALLRELETKNIELDRLNVELKHHIAVAERLADEKEKNRAVLLIQKTIGQSIAELLIGLEAIDASKSEQDASVMERLCEMIEKCRDVMAEIRCSVEKLSSRPYERGNRLD